METPGELSRSFKRRQRRKKQQERRRQADGVEDGTADGHEPHERPVTSPVSSPVSSPVTSPDQPTASGRGGGVGRTTEPAEKAVRGERTHSERTVSGGSGSGRTPGLETAGRGERTHSERTHSERTVSGGSDSHPRHKAARRGKRSSAAPSSAPPGGQSTKPATPAAADQRTEPPQPPEPPPVPVERVSPPLPVSAPEQRPAPHRESSPVVSCTEEVLQSVRALRNVLTELRTRLLAPPPESTAKSASSAQPAKSAPPAQTAQPAKSVQPAQPTQSTQSAKSAQPAQPDPQSTGVSSDAAMSPPADARPADQPEKTKEQIKAERKAKAEAAKLAKAAKALQKKQAATAEGGGDVGDKGGDKASGKPAKSGGASTAEAAAKPKPPKPTAAEALSKAIEKVSISAEETSGQQPAADKPAGEKSKAELKAERRAKQEAQRAAKAAAATAAKTPKGPGKPGKAAADHKTPAKAEQNEESASKSERRSAKKTVEKAAAKKGLQMFSHLLPFDASNVDALITKNGVHPALVPLLLRRSAGQLSGANAGAAALLAALADFVDSYMTPDQRELRRDLPERLARELSHLERCRPLSVAMQNVAQRLEQFIRHELPADKSDYEAKLLIIDWMKDFISDHICKAMDAITQFATEKIVDGDVILTYGRSSAVLDVLCHAHKKGRRFQVIVIDSRPRLEGRDMLRQLLAAGVPCSYGVITAISHHMKEATKVLLGAQALLSNGVLLSRAGTALVSLTGRALNRPVLVCCETYKFSDRLQTDSQVYNELGDPDELMTSPDSPLAGWRQSETLSLLNLEYDVTPPELVDVVITELGAIPCTSVPAVLRLQQLTSAY